MHICRGTIAAGCAVVLEDVASSVFDLGRHEILKQRQPVTTRRLRMRQDRSSRAVPTRAVLNKRVVVCSEGDSAVFIDVKKPHDMSPSL